VVTGDEHATAAALTVREMVLDHEHRVSDLEIWRAELRGSLALVGLALGTSLVSGALATVALVTMIAQVVSK
jgi:hypothetical protein